MAVATSPRIRARAVGDRGEIAAFLRRDRLYAAYALGDLDGPNRGRIAWAMAYDDAGRPTALAMHHDGLVPQPLFLMGAPDGCRAILEGVLKPRDAYVQGLELHEAALRDLYELEAPTVMRVMVVVGGPFPPCAVPTGGGRGPDGAAPNRLYQLGFRAG